MPYMQALKDHYRNHTMSRVRNRKPTHPGIVFKLDVLDAIGMTVSDAAKAMKVSRKHLSAFVNERIPCSRDLAKRLAIATETSVASWLNMQTALDVWEAERDTDEVYSAVSRLSAAG